MPEYDIHQSTARPFKIAHLPGGARLPFVAYPIDGRPWFIAHDVLKLLGLKGTALDALELGQCTARNVISGKERKCHSMVNESALYTLIFASTKGPALELKQWVTSAVLPCTRKNRGYLLGLEKLRKEDRQWPLTQVRAAADKVKR